MTIDATNAQGEQLFAAGQFEAALQVFEKLLEEQPDNLEALNNKGVVLARLGRRQEAEALLARVISQDNTYAAAIENILALLATSDNWRAVRTVLAEFGESLTAAQQEEWQRRYAAEKEKKAAETIKKVGVNWEYQNRQVGFQIILDLEEFSQQLMWSDLASRRMYEEETAVFLAQVVRPGDVVCDFGAHIGFFTLLAASLVGPEGHVHAVEPSQVNYNQLREHLQLNGLANVTTYNTLLGARQQQVDLWINCDNDGGHALWDVGKHQFNQQSRAIQLRKSMSGTSADALLAQTDLASCRLVKMDVEGAELEVMRGFKDALQRHEIPYVISEINRFALQQMGTTEGELRCFMEGLGYDTYYFPDSSGTVKKLATRETVNSQNVFNVLFSRTYPMFVSC